MAYEKGELLYEGKAKKIFSIPGESETLWVEFKDSLTAFNALKKGEFGSKGVVNRKIASMIFRYLNRQGVGNHWISDEGERSMICRKVTIIPLEVVVRNKLAGSTAKKFNFEEGTPLETPLVEFFYKNDELGDPFLSDEQAMMLKAAESYEQLKELKDQARIINVHLRTLFQEAGIELIDFKLEFGVDAGGKILLADEISPDSCRLWDLETGEKLDKDRFRRDLGQVEESYLEVSKRIQERWEKEL